MQITPWSKIKEDTYEKNEFLLKTYYIRSVVRWFQGIFEYFYKGYRYFFSYFTPWFLKPSIAYNSKMTDFSDIVFQ